MLIWSAAEGIVRVGERGGRCSGFVGGEDGWSGQRWHLRRGGHDGSSEGKAGGVGIVGACNREAAAPVASRRRQLLRRTCAAAAAICEGWSGLWLWGSATDGNAPGESIRKDSGTEGTYTMHRLVYRFTLEVASSVLDMLDRNVILT